MLPQILRTIQVIFFYSVRLHYFLGFKNNLKLNWELNTTAGKRTVCANLLQKR